jgi:hypothetical protein
MHKEHKPKEGSAAEEKGESAEEAQQEGDGVVIPEDFQQDVHNGLLKKATTKHHVSHIRDRVYAKEDEMRKAEEDKKSKGKKHKGPDEFSTDSAPASLNE